MSKIISIDKKTKIDYEQETFDIVKSINHKLNDIQTRLDQVDAMVAFNIFKDVEE